MGHEEVVIIAEWSKGAPLGGAEVLPYIPNSIKVALGIGQLRIGKLLFGGHSSKALHGVSYDQLPKQPLLN